MNVLVTKLRTLGPWLLGLTFFVLAGLAIQLSTVQLRSVTFVYGANVVQPDASAGFRVVVYDPLMNRIRDSVQGSWRLIEGDDVLHEGTLAGFGQATLNIDTPRGTTGDLSLIVSIQDDVLGISDVTVPLRHAMPTAELNPSNLLQTKHQVWAMSGSNSGLLVRIYPLNAYEIARGIEAPIVLEIQNESKLPVQDVLIETGGCTAATDLTGRAYCTIFTRSAGLNIQLTHAGETYRADIETTGLSQSLTGIEDDEGTTLRLATLPFKDIIHIDQWEGPYLLKAFDVPRQGTSYEWRPRWSNSALPEFVTAYRRLMSPQSTTTFYLKPSNLSGPYGIQTLTLFETQLGNRTIPLLASNKVANESAVFDRQTRLKSRVAQLMLLLGISVVGWIIAIGIHAHRQRTSRLQAWLLDDDNDDFDPDVMKLTRNTHPLEIFLGISVLVSFLFGLYVMLTELLRWGWELI